MQCRSICIRATLIVPKYFTFSILPTRQFGQLKLGDLEILEMHELESHRNESCHAVASTRPLVPSNATITSELRFENKTILGIWIMLFLGLCVDCRHALVSVTTHTASDLAATRDSKIHILHYIRIHSIIWACGRAPKTLSSTLKLAFAYYILA